jgi:hypothetical protein
MTNQDRQSAAVPKWEPLVHPRRRGSVTAAHRGGRSGGDWRYFAAYRRLLARHRRFIRQVGIGSGILAGILILGLAGLWWRLSSGPIQLDAFTPWLASAIADNFGSRERVEVGGTQIERTENGGAAVRVRDIVVRDPDGTVVASAPKAEIKVSGLSLLSGHMRAESLNLVGAALAVHIEPNGEVTVFASGGDNRPLATTSVPAAPVPNVAPGLRPAQGVPAPQAQMAPSRPASDVIAALLSWIDGIGETGLDGHDLRELGLKDGSLTVDDRRTGKKRTFHNITLSLERPHGGGVVVTLGSENSEHPWAMTAAMKPTRDGYRSIAFEARQVAASDLLLATRVDDGSLQTSLPISASLRGEIGPDGVPQSLVGRIVADAGFISDSDDSDGRIDIDRAEFKIDWDAATRVLSVPFQILSGGNRVTLMGEVQAPPQSPGPWTFRINGGSMVLSSPADPSNQLVLNRVALNGQFDPLKKRIAVNGGDFGNNDLGIAISGTGDYSSGDLRLTAGVAATRMPADSLRRIWPVFVSPKVRDWFNEHLAAGTLERLVIAVNAPLNTLKASGPPLPDDGLTVDALATNCTVTPVKGLPALHDADLTVHIIGRDAQIAVNRATADLPSGRKLVLSSGLFEVPDTAPRQPPANVHFKIEGPVPAAAELLAMDRLRDASGVPFDPATTRGNMSALVALGMPLRPDLPPGSTTYNISVDATNFAADKMIMGQKVEAAALKVSANNQGFAIKGDVKIGGTPANLEYKKMRGDELADVHIQGMLDETMRTNLALDPGNTISGSIPIDFAGRVGSAGDRDGRFTVAADLTPAQIDGFLPGWVKQSGKPARATFTLTTKPQSVRIDDLFIEGAGGGVKGTVELDGSSNLVAANFPSYGFSDGDRASLKVDRAPDGAYRVVMRGDAYDGRGFIKALVGSQANAQQPPAKAPDVDLDMKLGAILGFNGEALRGVEMKMSRRNGEVRSLGVNAKIGRNGTLTGDLRGRPGARQAIELQTSDAGAFFRFDDIYSRMNGGQMVTVIDAPSVSNPTQLGSLNVRNFSVHDETQLEQAVQVQAGPQAQQSGPQAPRGSNANNIDFTSMKVDFTRSQSRLALRDGVVRGPVLGGTIDGMIDYGRDEVHLRGTLVPLYGANNLLGQIPVVGLFLGGEKEGLLGVTYEVVGKPGTPILHVNPLSALAPGLLRKVFEFPQTAPYTPPTPPADADDSATNSLENSNPGGSANNFNNNYNYSR